MLEVIKRDGRKTLFRREKVEDAVLKAFLSVDGEISKYAEEKARNISGYVETILGDRGEAISVEEIQDLVEKGLMSCKRKDVARAFIVYRDERARERSRNSEITRQIGEKLFAENVENQNANIDEHSFGGRIGEASRVVTKDYALNYICSKMARENHLNNEVYIHDLDSYAVGMHNCLSVPFDDLLSKGFKVRQTDVRAAQSINTAFQLVAVIFQLQSLMQFGGVSATHLDWTMVPYVRKSFRKHYSDGLKYIQNTTDPYIKSVMEQIPEDTNIDHKLYKELYNSVYQYALDMTQKECKQAVEAMFHNLNTLQSRSGNQLKWMAG